MASSDPLNWRKQAKQVVGDVTVETVMEFLSSIHKTLTKASVDPGTITQLFKQVCRSLFS